MSISGKLLAVQQELKAPKGQYNSFGKYKYRSCEDILEALKPVLAKYQCVAMLSDDIVQIGERFYIRATASICDAETGEELSNTAYAREDADKKGMDGSQITGTASSYARKYALNGLFLIDDTKDADTDAYHEQTAGKPVKEKTSEKPAEETNPELVGEVEIETLKNVVRALGGVTENDFLRITGVRFADIGKMTKIDWGKLMVELNRQMDAAAHQRAMQHDA